MLGEKKTQDFSSLIVCPDLVQKFVRASFTAAQLPESALANKMRSSAKNRWEKEGPLLEALTGYQSLLWHFPQLGGLDTPYKG